MKEVIFDIDDAASDLSLLYRLASKYKESADPQLVDAGIKLEKHLCNLSTELLNLKVSKGSCGVSIPIIDEEVDLFHATERAERFKKAILDKDTVDDEASLEEAIQPLPNIDEGFVDNLGLF